MQDGRNIVVRALRFIPGGTEVSISYIEVEGNTADRQELLEKHYFFRCSCTRYIFSHNSTTIPQMLKGVIDDAPSVSFSVILIFPIVHQVQR